MFGFAVLCVIGLILYGVVASPEPKSPPPRPNASRPINPPPRPTATQRTTCSSGNTSPTPPPPPPPTVWNRIVIESPEEKDHDLRDFHVVNPEGELYMVDTADISNPFYGPVWTKIFTSLNDDVLLRGRAMMRRRSSDNYFAGYDIAIDGIKAFLPRSKSGIFYDESRDATNKCIAVKACQFQPVGVRAGNLLVETETPFRKIRSSSKKVKKDMEVWGLSQDYDHSSFHFTLPCQFFALPKREEVEAICKARGIKKGPDFMTGLFFKLIVLSTSRSADEPVYVRIEDVLL